MEGLRRTLEIARGALEPRRIPFAATLERFRACPDLDWGAIRRYAEIFDRWSQIEALRRQV